MLLISPKLTLCNKMFNNSRSISRFSHYLIILDNSYLIMLDTNTVPSTHYTSLSIIQVFISNDRGRGRGRMGKHYKFLSLLYPTAYYTKETIAQQKIFVTADLYQPFVIIFKISYNSYFVSLPLK